MDQLIELLESTLRPLHLPDEKIVTPSMVNNYVKQGILSAPRGKKYGRDNIARLIVIDVLKQAFSISDIDHLIKQQVASFSTPVAYDYFCTSLEDACHALFASTPEFPPLPDEGRSRRRLRTRSGHRVIGGRRLHALPEGEHRRDAQVATMLRAR